ncbi:nuclear transport factor 2 family protein [Novosphingobium sp. CF614]|uniref:nuclear transport factor 2 family protein n=1 Tax=Novosphingobium sp. CF614 TaxID=1884364 RepID=UPI001C432E22|nr:nuclear transport factor 2 family protein [Novosphingobium sp. CF614]
MIDIDPGLLRDYAKASIHSGVESWTHMEAEFVGNIDGLMETLVPEGPYAYTIVPRVAEDGSVSSPLITTAEEIRECYKFVRGRSDLISAEPLVDIRGGWYNFTAAINRGRVRGQDQITESFTIAIFPVSTGKGITGELVWARVPRTRLGAGPDPVEPMLEGDAGRRHLLALHNAYLEAMRRQDIEGMLAGMHDGVQANIRDYVNDTGTLIGIQSKDDYRTYLKGFFGKYEILSVDYLHRAMEDWYLFAETRVTMRDRDGRELAYNSADFFVPAKDNRVIVQTGHGTDLA